MDKYSFKVNNKTLEQYSSVFIVNFEQYDMVSLDVHIGKNLILKLTMKTVEKPVRFEQWKMWRSGKVSINKPNGSSPNFTSIIKRI